MPDRPITSAARGALRRLAAKLAKRPSVDPALPPRDLPSRDLPSRDLPSRDLPSRDLPARDLRPRPMRPLHPPAAVNDNPLATLVTEVERDLRIRGYLR